MLDALAKPPQLSCYTTSLVCYLAADIPAVPRRFAEATRLAVRTDLPASELAFSHHTRVDITGDGGELAYQGAADWRTAQNGLLAELEARGRVLAVANTKHIAWAPGYGRAAAPHWILICGRRPGSWKVADHFAALTPHGEQEPFLGWLDDAELAQALAPVEEFGPEVARRDRMALGCATAVPPMSHYRWLVRAQGDPTPAPQRRDGAPDDGQWLVEPVAVLSHVLATLLAEPVAAARYTDDLWAAARHYAHRNAVLVSDGLLDPETAAAETAAWQEIPKILRIAALSAARGRPRAGLVEEAFTDLIRSTEKSSALAPSEG
ncbi:hypothetical protein SAMN05216489_00600 [Streptomyces sp. 3213]|uniref:hypothetical protein n=1 Tax=Streptomyces sp. 3213.3 TaxID=1855348 RepID=UPI00089517B0|nr:hypothetical protein [Streptomyces sp. 3213.3]SEC38636.1 hypothetical protein SAMN05216489_00600 [Streptomyces sp. 3213] [Streptomyces sp. 3213.3]